MEVIITKLDDFEHKYKQKDEENKLLITNINKLKSQNDELTIVNSIKN